MDHPENKWVVVVRGPGGQLIARSVALTIGFASELVEGFELYHPGASVAIEPVGMADAHEFTTGDLTGAIRENVELQKRVAELEASAA